MFLLPLVDRGERMRAVLQSPSRVLDRLALPRSSWSLAARLTARRANSRRSVGPNLPRSAKKKPGGLQTLEIAPLFWPIY